MDKEEVKNTAKRVFLAEGIYWGAVAILGGVWWTYESIKQRRKIKKMSDDFWNDLSPKDRNSLRQEWRDSGKDVEKFVTNLYNSAPWFTRMSYNTPDTWRGMRILAKNIKKYLEEPMEVISKE